MMPARSSIRWKDETSVSDLTQLSRLTEDTVLKVLKERYEDDKIYTRCGDVLLSINPFKTLPIYSEEHHDEYSLESLHHDMEPHIFHTAAMAFKRLHETQTNQVVLVSGESGSGKTENTKYMVKHLMTICGRSHEGLEDKILEVNPVIEAFGNAQTVLNDNSSRFAKYLQLDFGKDGSIRGASIKDYMLEKSRVVNQGSGESNFHIFYKFLAGLTEEDRIFLSINKEKKYRIAKSRDKKRTSEDADDYRRYFEVLKKIGIPEEERDNIQRILAAIIHLTEIQFLEDPKSDTSEIWDEEPLNVVTLLLDTDPNAVTEALVSKKIHIPGQGDIQTVRRKRESEGVRDALAKALYERLFGWIIRKINESLHPCYDTAENAGSIGMVDICGFECLRENSFEQMCINLVNERMQGFMNEQIFREEQAIYQNEGVAGDCLDIQYTNNDHIVSLFMSKGILDQIDEYTIKLKQGTDSSLVHTLKERFANNQVFRTPPGANLTFGIKHFAREVSYDAKGFLEKNRDTLSPEMVKCMQDSQNEMVSDLFTVEKGDTGTISVTQFNYRKSTRHGMSSTRRTRGEHLSRSVIKDIRQSHNQFMASRRGASKIDGEEVTHVQTQTVTQYFKNSLDDLVDKLRNSGSSFVRCIKPNTKSAPDKFLDAEVVVQLKYNGIAEVARIRKEGWSIRKTFKDVLKRYEILSTSSEGTDVTRCEDILKVTGVQADQFTLGKKMLFMTDLALEKLEAELRRKGLELEEKREREEEESKRRKQEAEERTRRQLEKEASDKTGTSSPQGEVYSPLSDILEDEEASSSGMSSAEGTSGGSGSSSSSSHKDERVKTAAPKRSPTPPPTPYPSEESASPPRAPPAANDKQSHFWDVFRVVDTEVIRKETFDQMTFKVLKVLVYIFLFVIILCACVAQRLGLMVIISNIATNSSNKLVVSRQYDHYHMRLVHYVYLIIAMCIPYALSSLGSFFKWLFGVFPTPGVLTWLVVLLFEALHSVGLCALVFWVLPRYDIISGSLLLSATNIIPALLLLICSSQTIHGESKSRGGMKAFLDAIALLCQLSVIPMMLLYNFSQRKKVDITKINVANESLDFPGVICAFLLTSLQCWENFVDGRVHTLSGRPERKHFNNLVINKLLQIRYQLSEGRYAVSMIVGILKIIITCSFAYGVAYLQMGEEIGRLNRELLTTFELFDQLYLDPARFSSLLSVTIGGFVLYYGSFLACKLQMQRISLALPATLSIFVIQGLFTIHCEKEWVPFKVIAFYPGHQETCKLASDVAYMYYLSIAWVLSLLWITRHIWFPRQGRLEEYDRLFMNPFYCGILTFENILLNRRRHNEVIYEFEDDEKMHYFIAKPTLTTSQSDAETDTDSLDVPSVFACATMWHETQTEMTQLLKSLFRLDKAQAEREQFAYLHPGKTVADRFNFQGHIFFDDALELNEDEKWQVNPFVKMLVNVMDDASCAVHQKYMKTHDPYKVVTPYGAQLIWELPGGNLLYVHIKDKNKIRHRKRWSQVMYMYYLLGYQLLKESEDEIVKKARERDIMNKDGVAELFSLDVQKKTKNTFVLALDGDTDFSPSSVRILLDKMHNEKVAAVCGRIHPIGSGPLVWYQMFEYAVGHWLQKSAEHVLGCVLCSPGCFSLFRASALMDNNIMRKYTTMPTEPGHYLQYDQGEDRWLCTLLLQQGYRVDYAAAADAYTYAPEGFNEFFNQRRRWTPSTLANIMDLLSSSEATVARNSNISYLYIVYQMAMMAGTVLGPGTVIMMIAGSIQSVFKLELIVCYAISISIPTVYIVICFTTPSKVQLIVAAVLSAAYSFVMMAVIAGTVIIAYQESPLHPSVIFSVLLFAMFFIGGVLHWKELNCLPHCFMYFLCIPTGYLLLFIYSLCNLNNVSWGTREIAKRKTKKELAAEKKALKDKEEQAKKKDGFFARLFFSSTYIKELKQLLDGLKPKLTSSNDAIVEQLKLINETIVKIAEQSGHGNIGITRPEDDLTNDTPTSVTPYESPDSEEEEEEEEEDDDEPEEVDPYSGKHWVEDTAFGKGPVMQLCETEEGFWESFIAKYLKPIDKDEQKEKQIKEGLIELRDSICFAMIMLNSLWIAINFMFQWKRVLRVSIPYKDESGKQQELVVGILGLLFIAFFTILIIIQFLGMLLHRWETFLHLISMTNLRTDQTDSTKFSSDTEQIMETLRHELEPLPDYEDDDKEEDGREERMRSVIQRGETMRDLARSRRVNLAKSTMKPISVSRTTRNFNRDRDLNVPRPSRRYQQFDGGLRNRFYTPAINKVWSQVEVPNEGAIPWSGGDDPIYSEIRDVMPGTMGRDFARKVKRLKDRERDSRFTDQGGSGNGPTDRNGATFVSMFEPHGAQTTQF
ncbi:chitin synthase chs-1-like isoform X2 [Haliotis cracherodii]|uniref:chitin synthase chs-1-like isoform X2 n=1 Tax=Haliotis cracherodii TaxID=6455 RepID=UPI0039ED6438